MTLAPTNRLIILAFAAGLPVLTLAGWAGGSVEAAGLALVALMIPLALDAMAARGGARNLKVQAVSDERATQGREFGLAVNVSGGGRVRVALDPPDGWEGALETLDVGAGPEERSGTWKITPRDRGRHAIGAIYHECLSPLGLWAWRAKTPVATEIRVYPDLRADRGSLAPLFLRKAAIGLHRTRAIGKGREFEQLREYLPGDGYEDIEWKATARRGRPVTKVHQVERSQDVYMVVDASRRSSRRLSEVESAGGLAPTQMDRFVRAAMALTLAALQQGDRPGLAIFGSSLRHFLRAGGGRPQYNACRDKLFDLQAVPRPPDFADLFAELRNRVRHRALLVFLTDLDDPVLAAQFTEEVSALSRHHLVLVGQLQAPGTAPLFHDGPEPTDDEGVYRKVAGHLLWEGARQTKAKLRAAGVHCVTSSSENLVPDMISAYLNLKRRQLL
jgi:uncharacterized protein (DUF58 family)